MCIAPIYVNLLMCTYTILCIIIMVVSYNYIVSLHKLSYHLSGNMLRTASNNGWPCPTLLATLGSPWLFSLESAYTLPSPPLLRPSYLALAHVALDRTATYIVTRGKAQLADTYPCRLIIDLINYVPPPSPTHPTHCTSRYIDTALAIPSLQGPGYVH